MGEFVFEVSITAVVRVKAEAGLTDVGNAGVGR